MAAHLSYGRVNLNVLREAVRRELREFLDKCAGSKAIVWDEYLTGPFGLIAQYSLLKEHEVEKMFTLKGSRLPAADVKNIIFLVRPRLELMDMIAENVLSEDRRGPTRDFHILFVPRRSLLCEQRLKDLGVLGSFIYREEYSLDLIPFDGDLLSMESESAFKECYLEGDQTSLYHAAKGLMTLQALYGTIPQIFGKGECARQVANMMVRMKREFTGSQNSVFPVFDNLLLLDRNVDLLTPLASQLTYEGLIDEIYGIQNSYVKLPPEKFAPKKQGGGGGKDLPTEAKKLQLNSAEELYAEIRDKNFNAVGSVLSKKAKIISAAFEERHNAKTVGEIKQFVSQLPHMQAARGSLANHTSIAELIKDVTTSEDFFDKLTVEQEFMSGIDTDKVNNYIEDCIAQKHPLIKVLRLVCLQSVCNSGLKQKVLDYYKREILQTYGYEHILTLNNLEKAGLLKAQTGGRNNYPTIRKTLRLWMDDVNEQNPTDISYVYSGYAPLSVRLAQLLSRPGWRSIEEVLRILPGPHFEERQPLPTGLQKKRQPGENRVTLVFFLGGVTFAEIAALRFLSQLEDGGTEYVIATTKLINGSSWLEALMEKPF
ncbi:vacuolar protein sorting 33A (yeast), isoform CRA_a [Rattus norvegicus]|uniref:Vacuolar protein sorting-associated protein 33A n=2 Tax=Rattus norvegicus TaxID=10116 RepID=A0A9K3Y802_RAT|nr:vacuolar protein sorting-associated protein 33A [Rattus norvegicus]XP_032742640.1 vacuolar protein sorting-associated protein 33A [Rattus rattus]AAI05753.1 Vacuolar protein sorting 33 homolog A (S. cerevisiae) [Rattus norvegicus]EDM13629.1 vacuolar protein sorting 33A (yeast), isoform CRA_a [Rattus norvegicus]EDM13630.1 vacuolar protein sorting 33A (yeast), isoform CRA_a [Rattus norvegicus]|eukprot:NP_075250.2 vacuolar protein sorting-associated protein 33A [Rattus norvegicus]